MEQATQLWIWWLSLLSPFARVFTRPGWVRFGPWVTGMVWCWEEHTLTQMLTALGLASPWRVLEHFAEDGAWDRQAVESQPLRVLEQERPARWGRYHPVALDDTTGHRTSQKVWGACTFHEASARSPHRAETVRAHHGVVMGDLGPGRPWASLSPAARLYYRQRQRPLGETFHTKTALAVELLRQADAESVAPLLGVCDGADAVDTVIRPWLEPEVGRRRIAFGTRLRADARLYHPRVVRTAHTGRRPVWGSRIAAPQQHWYWPASWQRSRAWVDGRMHAFQDQQLRCRWAVSGPQIPVHVLVIQMAGYTEPWCLVTSALAWSAAQVVEVWAARFRQEDGCRDHKQRRGMAECRAWTKEPILRTFQVQLVAMRPLRLLHVQLERSWRAGPWWAKSPWNRRKRHASILDLRRLFWRHRPAFSPCLLSLENLENIPQPPALRHDLPGRAA
jgi:DDE superfamily endonuclease